MLVEVGTTWLRTERERRVTKRKKVEGCFSSPIAVFLPLCPDTTAGEVIILFLSSMHKHQSLNANERRRRIRKKKEAPLGTLKHHKSPDSRVKQ